MMKDGITDSMDGGEPGVGDEQEAWRAGIHGVAKDLTRLELLN